MTICKDPNDQTQRNAAAIAPFPGTVASDGALLPSFAAAAIEDYLSLISADIGINSQNNTPINKYVRQYGRDAFDTGLVAINKTLINRESFQNNLSDYPQLETRLSTQLPITPIEYANYMNEFLQTPFTVANLVNSNSPLVQSQLNDFYRNNFTQSAIGSFCALMPNVFAAIEGFFDLVEDAQQVFQDITDKINNFSSREFSIRALMTRLIGQIKEQVLKIVDDVVSKVRGIIENLSFDSIIGQIETFINDRIVARFVELRAQALEFFSEENIANLKRKIENLVNYASGVFRDPSLEEIQYLVYRFCAFAGQMEAAIDLFRRPLDDLIRDYQDTYNTLRSWGRVSTSEAVVNGAAIRLSDADRQREINNGRETEQRQPLSPPAGITSEERNDVENLTWENLLRDGRFEIPVGSNLSWGNGGFQSERIGWDNTSYNTKIALIRLQRLFGRRLRITSAYRSEAVNNELRRRGVRASATSFHLTGRALDIQWAGFPSGRDEFSRIARENCGFREIITSYSSFVHVGNTSLA